MLLNGRRLSNLQVSSKTSIDQNTYVTTITLILISKTTSQPKCPCLSWAASYCPFSLNFCFPFLILQIVCSVWRLARRLSVLVYQTWWQPGAYGILRQLPFKITKLKKKKKVYLQGHFIIRTQPIEVWIRLQVK